jgi:hypothetical protein
MMKPSEMFGGIGSVATSAVPVLENITSTSGRLVTAFSTPRCIRSDCSSAVDGMRGRGQREVPLVQLVGMNSWPRSVKTNAGHGEDPEPAPMKGQGGPPLCRRTAHSAP